MMAPSGANCEKEGTSSTSGSENFMRYLNFSSENEGDSAPEPSTASSHGQFIMPSPAISQSELLGARGKGLLRKQGRPTKAPLPIRINQIR